MGTMNDTTKSVQKRGMLTERIKKKSHELLGYEITVRQLRLMPYLMHVMMDRQRIDPSKVSGDERKILQQWREEGHIEGGASGLVITRKFWDVMAEIVFLGYVDLF